MESSVDVILHFSISSQSEDSTKERICHCVLCMSPDLNLTSAAVTEAGTWL